MPKVQLPVIKICQQKPEYYQERVDSGFYLFGHSVLISFYFSGLVLLFWKLIKSTAEHSLIVTALEFLAR